MTQPIQDVIDRIVAASIMDIGNSLDCTDTAAAEHFAHGIHQLTYPKVEKPKRVRKYPPSSRRTPTFKRITFSQLQHKYWYDSEKGELHYRRDGYKFYKDTPAWWYGNGKENPLKMVYHEGHNYGHSRLVWFYHHGVMPREVLHTNGNMLDDRIENLEDADHSTMCRIAQSRGKDINQRAMPDTDFFAYQQEPSNDTVPELIIPSELEEQEMADPIAEIDAAFFHRDCEKPWTVFLIKNNKVIADHGDYYTIAEAYAVWRNIRDK